jgi:hypothetical protein
MTITVQDVIDYVNAGASAANLVADALGTARELVNNYVGGESAYVVPSIVGSLTTATDLSSGTPVVPSPTGGIEGDLVLLFVRNHQGGSEPSSEGFVSLGVAYDEPVSQTRRRSRVLGKFVGPDPEPAQYVLSLAGGGRTVVTAALVRNVDPITPVSGYSSPYGGSSVPGQDGIIAGNATLDTIPALGVVMFGAEFTAGNDHVPTSLPALWSPLSEVVAYVNGVPDLSGTRSYQWTGVRQLDASPAPDAAISWTAPSSGIGAEMVALRGTGNSDVNGVPGWAIDQAVKLTAAYIYAQRNAPNGVVNSQFVTDAGVTATTFRIARDPMYLAYPILNRFVPQW